MEQTIENLPEHIKKHLEKILKSSGMPENEESLRQMTEIWIEKSKAFNDQIKLLDMIETESLDKEENKAVLILTYSGSLISFGSVKDGKRWGEYASIKLRNDVPALVKQNDASIKNDIAVDNIIEFDNGPLKSTSSIYKIAVCGDDVPIEEQEKRVREATIFLTNSFIKINRTVLQEIEGSPDQFNQKTIVAYLADKNEITQKLAKQILDDYHMILESGMILGESVPLGKMGKLSLNKKAAQKARVGINPATGEKITIAAKPEVMVPRMKFNKGIKERVASLDVEQY